MSLYADLERIAAQERATGVSRLGGSKPHPFADLESIAKTVLDIPADPSGELVFIYVYGRGEAEVQFGSPNALDHTAAEWGDWYDTSATGEQRSKKIKVGGVEFMTIETRRKVVTEATEGKPTTKELTT